MRIHGPSILKNPHLMHDTYFLYILRHTHQYNLCSLGSQEIPDRLLVSGKGRRFLCDYLVSSSLHVELKSSFRSIQPHRVSHNKLPILDLSYTRGLNRSHRCHQFSLLLSIILLFPLENLSLIHNLHYLRPFLPYYNQRPMTLQLEGQIALVPLLLKICQTQIRLNTRIP